MNERIVQLRVGVMVLASLLVGLILLVLFNEPRAFLKGQYHLQILFPQAPGVSKNTPIRKSGILIGRVRDVDLVPDGGAIVTASIDGNRRLRRNENFHIVTTLLGDAAIEVIPSRDPSAPSTILKDGDEISGMVRSDPIEVISNLEGSLANAIDSVAATSNELGKVVRRFGVLLDVNEDHINKIIAEAGATLESVRQVADAANSIVGDPQMQEQLRAAMTRLPQIAEEAELVIRQMNASLASVERNLKNVEGLTEPLGRRGELLASRIERGAENLDRLIAELLVFSQALNNPRSPVRQFLNDDDFYPHVKRTVQNIDELTRRLRPVVDDARIAVSKIARDPSRLGVGGALRKYPPIK